MVPHDPVANGDYDVEYDGAQGAISYATKETISKVKRQPSEWEKMIANETTDKQLISKIYKQFLQLNFF